MKVESRKASRMTWMVGSDEAGPACEQINTGSLQRIADACEAMAKNHITLMNERDRFERWYREAEKKCARKDKQIAAYRGIVKRLKAQPVEKEASDG